MSSATGVCANYRLSPFPEKANCSVDHNHDDYDLNHMLNSHIAAS
jgi:hypothetical protein